MSSYVVHQHATRVGLLVPVMPGLTLTGSSVEMYLVKPDRSKIKVSPVAPVNGDLYLVYRTKMGDLSLLGSYVLEARIILAGGAYVVLSPTIFTVYSEGQDGIGALALSPTQSTVEEAAYPTTPPTTTIDFTGRRGINAADPVSSQDVATKSFVLSVLAGGGADLLSPGPIGTTTPDVVAATSLRAPTVGTNAGNQHPIPSGTDTLAVVSDSRFTDSRAPTSHADAHEPGGADAMEVDATSDTGSLRTLGTGARQAAPGNDSRLSNSRSPTAHATTHRDGGADDLLSAPGRIGRVTPAQVDATVSTASSRVETPTIGTGPSAQHALPTGTADLVASDDARMSDSRSPTSHASSHEPSGADAMAVDAAAATGSLRTLGSGAQQAAPGNDSRLSNARTPTSHASSHEPGGADAIDVDAAVDVGSLRTLGTGAQQAAAGNDSRLSDARTPTAHASTHMADGADPVRQQINFSSSVSVLGQVEVAVGSAYLLNGVALSIKADIGCVNAAHTSYLKFYRRDTSALVLTITGAGLLSERTSAYTPAWSGLYDITLVTNNDIGVGLCRSVRS